jgi:hypothetical protein
MLPLTSTLDGAESELLLPSKMRTFWNNVAPALAGGSPCARTAGDSPTPISGSVATNARREMEVMHCVPTYRGMDHCSISTAVRGVRFVMLNGEGGTTFKNRFAINGATASPWHRGDLSSRSSL